MISTCLDGAGSTTNHICNPTYRILWPSRRLRSNTMCTRANYTILYFRPNIHKSPWPSKPGISDHEIFTELAVHLNYGKRLRRRVWMHSRADWSGMIQYLSPRMACIKQEYNPWPDADALWNKKKTWDNQSHGDFHPKMPYEEQRLSTMVW